jgi:CheY-like chemotaxis protein
MAKSACLRHNAGILHPSAPIVAVVEDETTVRALLVRVLTVNGFTPLGTSSVPELIAIAQEHPVDAFVVDLNLGQGQSGLDCLSWLRQQPHYARTPALVLTGAVDLPEEQEATIRRHRAHLFHKGQSLRHMTDYLQRLLIDANPH